jgi:hypothetical protein
MLLFVLTSISSQAQRAMELVGEPDNSHGYLLWTTDTALINYYRYTISERIVDTNGVQLNIVERGEIWDQTFIYIDPVYWRSDKIQGNGYSILIQGVDDNGMDIPNEEIQICSGCNSGFDGCYWECISSHYAYRIQQNGGYNGPGSYNYQLQEARDEDIDGTSSFYYEWFNASDFESFTETGGTGDPDYRGMPFFNPAYQINLEPYFMIAFPPNGETYYDGFGHIIEGDIYGIKKGLGPWYMHNSEQVVNYTGDKCDMPGDQGQATFGHMRNFMNSELDLNQNLECAHDLGQGGYIYPDEPDYEQMVYLMGTYFGDQNTGGDDDGDNEDGGGIILNDGNWEYYVCELMNFTLETYLDTSLRYSEMLMDAQLFSILKLGDSGYEPFFIGNLTSFADSTGVPNMPVLTFDEGLYKLTFKRTGYPLFYGVFEVRNRFQATLPHKDFFSATIYPNPNVNPHFFIDVQTTARLWVRYEIFDSNSNKLFEYTIQLPKDHDGTHRIEPDPVLPDGFLYHRFSFIDGSYETITTIKN